MDEWAITWVNINALTRPTPAPMTRQFAALLQHPAENIHTICTQRHADADLLCALTHQVDTTPYKPTAASSNATPAKRPSRIIENLCAASEAAMICFMVSVP